MAHRQVQGSGMIKAMSMIIKTRKKIITCVATYSSSPVMYGMQDSVICCTDTYIAKHAFHFVGILLKVCMKTVSEETNNYMFYCKSKFFSIFV